MTKQQKKIYQKSITKKVGQLMIAGWLRIFSVGIIVYYGGPIIEYTRQMFLLDALKTSNSETIHRSDSDLKGIQFFQEGDLTGAYQFFSNNKRISPYNESVLRIYMALDESYSKDYTQFQKGKEIEKELGKNTRAKIIIGTKKIEQQREKIRQILKQQEQKMGCEGKDTPCNKQETNESQTGANQRTQDNSTKKITDNTQSDEETTSGSMNEKIQQSQIPNGAIGQEFEIRNLSLDQILKLIHEKEKKYKEQIKTHTQKGNYEYISELDIFFSQFIGDTKVFQQNTSSKTGQSYGR